MSGGASQPLRAVSLVRVVVQMRVVVQVQVVLPVMLRVAVSMQHKVLARPRCAAGSVQGREAPQGQCGAPPRSRVSATENLP
ncbi:hypothetical protein SAMN05421538_1032 [Paracoccus isoporae]|uniref:Uncharacterized protein n=1 Tax=Paracoccus isoporae TaxID=591205 RepID=A0A1G6YJU4_9RHOB|nr:hypothetical protein SAMN05421538_1032 [Paracoccus isoporae]